MRRLKRPVREVVEALLKYEFGDCKVFKLMGHGFKSGDTLPDEEASLEKESSLGLPKYTILYIHKIAGGGERRVDFGRLKKNPRIPGETLLSDPMLREDDAERIEEGYRRLEDALEGM